MYYFWILEILNGEEGKKFTILEMVAELQSRGHEVNTLTIQRVLKKLFLEIDYVYRDSIEVHIKGKRAHFVYYTKKSI